MKKLGIIIVLLVMGILSTQCTEDETVESAEYKEIQMIDGGEEGDQELDSERD